MLMYMAYNKQTGKIVHVHRAVDSEGHSRSCSDEEVLNVLPAGIDRKDVGVIATSFDEVPSGRALNLHVDVGSGVLVKEPIQSPSTGRRGVLVKEPIQSPSTRRRR